MPLPRLSLPLLLILAVPGLAQRAHVAPPLPEPLRPLFGGPQYFALGGSRQLSSADLDGDGDTDLLISQVYSASTSSEECWPPTVDVLRNRGNGSFGPPESNAFPPNFCEVNHLATTVADIDGDGSPDVAGVYTYSTGAPKLAVLANSGNGQLVTHAEYQVQSGEERLLSADVDLDGDVDLLRGNAGADRLDVFRNQGNGTFVPTAQFGLPVDYLQTTADLELDGDVDLVDGRNTLDVFPNLGNGTFALGASTVVGAFAHATHADLDRDGYEDLVTGHGSVLLNLGNGAFAPPMHHDTGGEDEHVAVGDLDRDGDTDVVVGYDGSRGTAAVLSNLGAGSLAPVVRYDVGIGPVSSILANIDGDGHLDSATVSFFGAVTVLHNRRDGTFGLSEPLAVGTEPVAIVDADLDADGDADLVTANSGSDDVSLLWNDGNGSYPLRTDLFAGNSPSDIVDLDLNGDGSLDLATASSAVSVILNQGDGSFASAVEYGGAGSWSLTGADLDGDGDADLATAWMDVAVLENQGSGSFGPATHHSVGPFHFAWSIVHADADLDGDLDLATANVYDGPAASPEPVYSLCVLLNHGDGTFGSPTTYGALGRGLISADLDLDGAPDFATTGVSVLRNRGDGTLAPAEPHPVLDFEFLGLLSLTSADLDGEGAPDLIAGSDLRVVHVLRNRGDGRFRAPVAYTAVDSDEAVTAADLDGDGDVDLATAGSSGATVLMNLRR